MAPDDELCLCFHVTQRKVEQFIRIEAPRVPSQLSACGGAGTGCGWCRPFLENLLKRSLQADVKKTDAVADSFAPESCATEDYTAEDYQAQRADYIRQGKGTPP